MKVVDLSGYSFSGKSAYYDFMSSLRCTASLGVEREFDLVRVKDGIYDLFECLTDINWSLIRSSEAIRRFQLLVRFLGGKKTFFSRFYMSGTYYDDLFPGFSSISSVFLEQLTQGSYSSYWPFPQYTSESYSFKSKLSNKLFSIPAKINISRFEKDQLLPLVRSYLDSLFSEYAHSGYEVMLLSNAFETSSPQSSLRFISDSYSIVVDRDPRDIYASAYLTFKERRSLAAQAVLGSCPEDFILRFKAQRQSKPSVHPRVLRLRYEDLMLDFDRVMEVISGFLDLPFASFQDFDFYPSCDNIRIWRRYSDDPYLKSGIQSIESSLSHYCYL